MSGLLFQKVALVTGGNGGIGKGIVKRFLEEGASCAIFGTSISKGQQTCEEFKSLLKEGQTLQFFQVNVSNAQEVDNGIKEVLEKFGKIDVLVNNAGITKDNLLMKMSEEEWDQVLDVNLKSLYNTCKAIVRPMLKAKSGKIINITSVVGVIGNPGQTNYAASKAGMIGFTKSLAKELGSRNICVNAIAPGFIQTEMTGELTDKHKENYLNQIPLGRFGSVEEIANAALYLASSWSSYMTGQVLVVDGGMVMYQ